MKKYAVLGAGVYGGYKLGKLREKFSRSSHYFGRPHGYGGYGGYGGYSGGYSGYGSFGFDDWNRLREDEGQLCRNNEDCEWVDPRMFCQNYKLEFTPNVSGKTPPKNTGRAYWAEGRGS